jgi:hypothetical protein
MSRMPHFSPGQQRALDALARDLDQVFGPRLRSLVAYPGHHADGSVHSLALVDSLAFRDLVSCMPFTQSWRHRGAAVPLLLGTDELQRTIDVFPLEYAGIIADYAVVRGADPFRGVAIDTEDLRRACEAQAKSHLIHLRESFLETHAETTRVTRVITASAAPLRTLLINIARLPEGGPHTAAPVTDDDLARMAEHRMGVPAAIVREVLATSGQGASSVTDPSHLLAGYIDAAKKIWEYVDRWSKAK